MKSLDELKAIRNANESKMNVREHPEDKTRVLVGMATCGIASGARPVMNALSDAVQEDGMTDKIAVTPTGCIGLCQYEPIVEVLEPGKEKVTYIKMTPTKVLGRYMNAEEAEEERKKGNVVTKYTLNAVKI